MLALGIAPLHGIIPAHMRDRVQAARGMAALELIILRQCPQAHPFPLLLHDRVFSDFKLLDP